MFSPIFCGSLLQSAARAHVGERDGKKSNGYDGEDEGLA